MARLLFHRFERLNHWVYIEDKEINDALKDRKISRLFVDIFDDDIFSSKASYIGNAVLIFLIFISSLEIILNSDLSLVEYAPWFKAIDILTTLVFSFEIIGRVVLAGYIDKRYETFWGKIRYLTSFYGIIDLLSVVPFYFGFWFLGSFHWLKILRIFRIWRIVRYIPAFSNITGALRRKGDEILVSLAGIFLLSLTISSLIFYAEKSAGSKEFESIMGVFVWSIGKYTGDYGAIANETPLTLFGKFFATLNGVLGIALFALPAGLLGSAFIEQMEENKKSVLTKCRVDSIDSYFDMHSSRRKERRRRFVTFDELQVRFLFTNDEIIDTIRKSDNLRFRAVKSDDQNRYNDVEIIERFDKNEIYGYKFLDKESRVCIINPSGAEKIGISHFTHSLATALCYSFLSVEEMFISNDHDEIDPWYTRYFDEIPSSDVDVYVDISNKFNKFMDDISSIASCHDWVIVFSSADVIQSDVDLEYGNEKGTANFVFHNSTLSDEQTFRQFEESLNRNLNSENAMRSYSISHHAIGSSEPQWMGRAIHRFNKANVLTIYIHSKIMTSSDDKYNHVLNAFSDTLKEIFGDNNVLAP